MNFGKVVSVINVIFILLVLVYDATAIYGYWFGNPEDFDFYLIVLVNYVAVNEFLLRTYQKK